MVARQNRSQVKKPEAAGGSSPAPADSEAAATNELLIETMARLEGVVIEVRERLHWLDKWREQQTPRKARPSDKEQPQAGEGSLLGAVTDGSQLATVNHLGKLDQLIGQQQQTVRRLDGLAKLLGGRQPEDLRQLAHRQSRQDAEQVALDAISSDLGALREQRQADLQVLGELKAENRLLRGDYYRASLKPAALALFAIYDLAETMVIANPDDGSVGALLPQVEQLLGQFFDAWPYRPALGAPVEAEKHQAVGFIHDDNEAPDRVAALIRIGFMSRQDGSIHRKAAVTVYR